MPFKKNLLFVFTVTGSELFLKSSDIDNLSKSILDAFKGILYIDDAQVHYLVARKSLDELNGLIVGIKEFSSGIVFPSVEPFYL